VDPFSFVRKSLFYGFFILCTKTEQYRFTPETAVNIGSTIFSSTELSTGCDGLIAFRQYQQIARCERGFAEGAELNGVALLKEKKRSIENQPKLQRASEKPAQQLQVADLRQALPTGSLQG
jgi:hypothetical protein